MKYKILNHPGWLRVTCSPVDWDNDFGALFNYNDGERMVCLYEKSFKSLESRLPVSMKRQASNYKDFSCQTPEEFLANCILLHNLEEKENIVPDDIRKINKCIMRDFFHFDVALWHSGIPPKRLTPSLQGLVGLYNYDEMKGINHDTSILILLSSKQIQRAHSENIPPKCFIMIVRNLNLDESFSFFQTVFKPEYEKWVPPSERQDETHAAAKSTGCALFLAVPALLAITTILAFVPHS